MGEAIVRKRPKRPSSGVPHATWHGHVPHHVPPKRLYCRCCVTRRPNGVHSLERRLLGSLRQDKLVALWQSSRLLVCILHQVMRKRPHRMCLGDVHPMPEPTHRLLKHRMSLFDHECRFKSNLEFTHERTSSIRKFACALNLAGSNVAEYSCSRSVSSDSRWCSNDHRRWQIVSLKVGPPHRE